MLCLLLLQLKKLLLDTYEDPDAAPTPQHATVRNSALPPLPKGANQKSFVPQVEQQDVYEDPDEAPPQPTPSRTKMAALPPTPKASQQKSPYHGRKAPAAPKQEEFEQLEYEVPEEVLKGQMPQDDYMTMQPSPEDTKKKNKKKGHEGVQVFPVQNGGQNATLPPRPGKHKQLPVPPMDTAPASPAEVKRESSGRTKVEKVNKALSLEEQPWYHGEIERNVADNKLLGIGTNGCYLIRKSKKGGETKPYTLAIFYESQVFNLNIRKKPNHQYALGMAKPGEQEFSNLMDLVTFFQGHRLILAKGQTRLKLAISLIVNPAAAAAADNDFSLTQFVLDAATAGEANQPNFDFGDFDMSFLGIRTIPIAQITDFPPLYQMKR
ncbi:unnamed protein product [Mytilus coruscus]|uniref:SH2 domain-containing protein n=1 Tax=Mytilus coruscus TaxID=42192 RepID=A0A6J8EZG7_MYTCO|nr:unnamed protein product [Mytilus coruscus]